MILLAIVVGALGAVIGLIAYGVFCLCNESRKAKPKEKVDYSQYTETDKDKLLKEKDNELKKKEAIIEILSKELNSYSLSSSDSLSNDITKQVSKGVRDGIARSQMEHGQDIGNYGLSDHFFQ